MVLTQAAEEQTGFWDAAPELARLTLLLVILLLMFGSKRSPGRRLLYSVASRVKAIKALGAEVEFENKEQIELSLDDTLKRFRDTTWLLYDQQRNVHRIDGLLAAIVDTDVPAVLEQTMAPAPKVGKLRATLYIDHALLPGYLLQLTPYYPAGRGAGRAFSIRWGIIGKVWRSEVSETADLPGPEDPKDKMLELQSRWGLTRAEAEDQRTSRSQVSFAAIAIRDYSGRPIGLLYMDTDGRLFGDSLGDQPGSLARRLEDRLAHHPELSRKLCAIHESVATKTPRIKIPHDQQF